MKTIQLLAILLIYPITTNCQAFIEAIKDNDFERAIQLVSIETINIPDENGATPLMWATYKSDLRMVKALVDKGADYKKKGVIYLDEEKNSYYGSIVTICAGEGKLDILVYFLEECNIDIEDKEYELTSGKETGWTALQWAAAKGQNNIISFLLLKGADINTQYSYDQMTPLLCALFGLEKSSFALLIEEGANPDLKNTEGWAAIHYATRYGLWDVLEFLIENGANINEQTTEGWTPLLLLANYNYNEYIYQYLISKGADRNRLSPDGKSLEFLIEEYSKSFSYYKDKTQELLKLGEIDSAIKYALLAREKSISESGTESLDYAISLNNLGLIYQLIGEFEQAIEVLYESIEIYQKSIGENYISYADAQGNLAMIYTSLGDYEKSETLYLKSIARKKIILGDKHPDNVNAINNLALLYYKTGKYALAEELYNEALNICKEALGEEHIDSVTPLANLGLLHQTMGNYDLAKDIFLRAVEITKANQGENHPNYSDLLVMLAGLYNAMGNTSEALALFNEAIEVQKRIFGEASYSYAKILLGYATTYQLSGSYHEAEMNYIKGIEILKRIFGEEHYDYVEANAHLADLYREMGKYEKAKDLIMNVMGLYSDKLNKEHPSYNTVLNNLAVIEHNIGNYFEAELLYREALEIQKNLTGEMGIDYARGISNLALLKQELNHFAEAELLFQKSLDLQRSIGGERNPSYALTLNNLALFYHYIGNYSSAEELFQSVLLILENTIGETNSFYALVLTNLAQINTQTLNYFKADVMLKQAISIQKQTLSEDHPSYALSLNNLGLVKYYLGNFAEADSLFQLSIGIFKRVLGENHPYVATSLNNISLLYKDIGDYQGSENYLKQAITTTSKTFGEYHIQYYLLISNLALHYDEIGDYNKAELAYIKANNILNKSIKENFAYMSEIQKKEYIKTIEYHYDYYYSFILGSKDYNPSLSKLAYDNELLRKGIILNSMTSMQQSILESNDTIMINQFEALTLTKQQINQLSQVPVSERSINLEDLQNKADEIEKKLVRISSDFSSVYKNFNTKWQNVKSDLKQNEAAIEFLNFAYFDGTDYYNNDLYCALILRNNDSHPEMTFLFEADELSEIIPGQEGNQWEYNLAYQGSRAAGTAYFEMDAYTGDKLYELIWQPIDSLLQEKGIETIYFAPSGLLHTVSFAAIPTPDGELLMEKYNLVQLGSTRTVAMQQEPVELKNAIVFGGIDYDLEGEELELIAQQFKENESFAFQYMPYRASGTRYGGFTYLEGSLVEARKVTGLLSKKISTTKITGRDAVEESFKALSGSHAPSVIHIATHGFYFPDTISDKRREQIMFAAIGEERFRISDDPLMRSALVMAGANHGWKGKTLPPGVQDGILTARDVSAMNLSNTELVVLSACQTGLGDVKGSEGVTGLQRAFKMAGVRYIIMSLWPVPDKETVEFMEAFYGNWLGGMEIRIAFNTTQKQMHAKYPNEPFKWAAFVLME